jgi:N-acyl-D-aspartate/D-glutamate deacylase
MGDRGGDHTSVPTDDELARMAELTGEAMRAGALGFSTSRTYVHRSRDGANIGTLTASARELMAVAGALREAGKGVIQLISDAYLTDDDAFAEAELALIRKLAEVSGRKLSFTVQQTDDSPDRWRGIFAEIAAMTADGLDVRAQVAPRPVGVLLSFASTTNPFILTPTYRKTMTESRSVDERLRRLAQPEVRAAILDEHRQIRPASGFAATLTHGYERMYRMTDPVDYEPRPDQSLAAEAGRQGREAAEVAYDTLMEEGGRRLLYMPLLNYTHGNLDDVHGMITAEHTLFGLSDGGAHCGTISDGSFPTTTIALWSKGSKSGLKAPLEALVHGYTQRNAEHVGWRDRGVIAPGYLADLNVIDLDNLSLSPPRIVQDLPAGGTRLLQTARGYLHTIKSGAVTFENGTWTGETPGGLLRGERATPAPALVS